MLSKLRRRAQDEKGFTLIELLVVILIIGILAAIAIPSFLGQKSKASDSSAKELARTAQTAAETIATDNGGSYVNVTTSNLKAYEATIPTASGSGNAWVSGAGGTATGYSVIATSTNGDTFTITNTAGTVTRACAVASGNSNTGGCVGSSW